MNGGGGAGVAYLIDNATRHISFQGGRLDPNRMFSNEGAQYSLERLNPSWSAGRICSGVTYLALHRHELVNRLLPPPGGLLIALHNNQRGYNFETEVPTSDATALNDPENSGDFALVVDPADFQRLRNSRYNVVLQANLRGREDGSLSRLARRLNVRYVNLEARMGNREKQDAMLRWIEEALA